MCVFSCIILLIIRQNFAGMRAHFQEILTKLFRETCQKDELNFLCGQVLILMKWSPTDSVLLLIETAVYSIQVFYASQCTLNVMINCIIFNVALFTYGLSLSSRSSSVVNSDIVHFGILVPPCYTPFFTVFSIIVHFFDLM